MPQIAAFRGTLEAASRDASPALYRYHQVFQLDGRSVTRKALVAAVRMSPWSERLVRPHEATDPKERDAVLAEVRAGKAIAPIFAGFRDAAGEVERAFRGVDSSRPAVEYTTADGVVHRLWRVGSAEVRGPLQRAFAHKKVHILASPARYEGLLAHSDALDAKAPLVMYSSAKYAPMCLVDLDDATVYKTTVARHRVVRGKVDAAAILGARTKFIVEKLAGSARDAKKLVAALADTVAHQPAFAIAFKGDPDAYKLTLSPDVSPAREGVPVHRALQKLDPVVLEYVLKPIGFPDATLVAELDPAKAVAADGDATILMRAVPLNELIHVDELGETLPAGSTAFAPGVEPRVAMTIDPDEDVV